MCECFQTLSIQRAFLLCPLRESLSKVLPSTTLDKQDSAYLLLANSVCRVQSHEHSVKSLPSVKSCTRQTFLHKIKKIPELAAAAPLAGQARRHCARLQPPPCRPVPAAGRLQPPPRQSTPAAARCCFRAGSASVPCRTASSSQ